MKKDSRKYYAAYEERYKTAHANGVSWSSDVNTPIVMEVIAGKAEIPGRSWIMVFR